ncbi:hypothetical protein C8R43DRAFT_964278 [Mycena crocata]|nr:hypothetical protein C8R43DRAFT_964278 [Mycena crocata]
MSRKSLMVIKWKTDATTTRTPRMTLDDSSHVDGSIVLSLFQAISCRFTPKSCTKCDLAEKSLSKVKPKVRFLSDQNLAFGAKMRIFCPTPDLAYQPIIRGPAPTRHRSNRTEALIEPGINAPGIKRRTWGSPPPFCLDAGTVRLILRSIRLFNSRVAGDGERPPVVATGVQGRADSEKHEYAGGPSYAGEKNMMTEGEIAAYQADLYAACEWPHWGHRAPWSQTMSVAERRQSGGLDPHGYIQHPAVLPKGHNDVVEPCPERGT